MESRLYWIPEIPSSHGCPCTHHKQHAIELRSQKFLAIANRSKLYRSISLQIDSYQIPKNLTWPHSHLNSIHPRSQLTSLPCARYVPPLAYSSWYKSQGLNRKKVPQRAARLGKLMVSTDKVRQICFSQTNLFPNPHDSSQMINWKNSLWRINIIHTICHKS